MACVMGVKCDNPIRHASLIWITKARVKQILCEGRSITQSLRQKLGLGHGRQYCVCAMDPSLAYIFINRVNRIILVRKRPNLDWQPMQGVPASIQEFSHRNGSWATDQVL